MPPPSTSRDRVVRHLLDVNRHNRQSHSPLPFGRARRDRGTVTRDSPKISLAFATGVAPSWVNEVLSELQANGWVDSNRPLQVLDPHAVFAWWRQRRAPPRIHGFQAQDPKLLAHQLAERGVHNAITTFYGENQHHGHLFPRRMDTYVRLDELPRAREIIIELGGQLGGTNFRLWTGDDAVVDDRQPGAPGPLRLDFAMVPQIILDLYLEGGSAAEAAALMVKKEFLYASNPGL